MSQERGTGVQVSAWNQMCFLFTFAENLLRSTAITWQLVSFWAENVTDDDDATGDGDDDDEDDNDDVDIDVVTGGNDEDDVTGDDDWWWT